MRRRVEGNAPMVRSYSDGYAIVQQLPTCHVSEDHDPQPTGLLDANGTPLSRVQERVPMGFQPPDKDRR